ncbi:hypothetical protein S40285_00645 [Stachybotrys chlorohalonatus IBT 40285]|uniref:mRNA export factor MEX67 n=1 Tax=Stachybotrys chlorohalonatus (strain IBT 40285) TaxID=1283841 RepID=A0A084R2R2_STAC4|nr:hypothetical protein S40285_00645 [Stachybotrys chlorohalonata IBT 40285]
MAPRGARGNAAPAGRATRNSSLTSKPSTRGGISKRKGPPTRTDVDGDLDMDSAARKTRRSTPADPSNPRSRPSTRSSNPNTRGASRTARTVLKHLGHGEPAHLASRISGAGSSRQQRSRAAQSGPLSYLRVRGLAQSKAARNPDGGLGDLLSFLERKASALTPEQQKRSVIIIKSHMVGDYVFIGASAEDAQEILKINSFQFAGTDLEIVESTEGLGYQSKATESKETQELRGRLQAILSQRYLGASKLLKLDALAADAELVSLGMFENRERALKTFKGLMAICDSLFKTAKEKQEAIESISLANNNIDDVTQVEMVATTFPHLKNLDMSGNHLSSMQGLDRWKGKFRELDTIYVTGNPIETADPNFHAALLDWFPKLRVINGTELRTAEQIAAQAVAASQANPIPQNGPDFRDMNGIGENFLLEFFAAYDSDRPSLAAKYYDDNSQFSLAVDALSVRDPNAPPPLPWASYIRASRNLIKINTQHAKVQRLFKGANMIGELWKGLPATRHPNIKEELSKYIMDCHPLTGLVDPSGQSPLGVDGLVVSVHGEFEEYDQKTDTMGKRSFSRSFILGPGQPGRNPIRVVSDMISLRAYSPLPNVFAPSTQQASQPDQQQAMMMELSKQTGMVPEYSRLCLEQVNWDFNQALVVFNEKKAQLPPAAFAQS